MRRIIWFNLLLLVAAGASVGCASNCADSFDLSKVPNHLHLDGITLVELEGDLPNFHQISETVYPGAQPRQQGLRELRELGIKTIVNLRDVQQDADAIESFGFAYHHFPTQPWEIDEDAIITFLKEVTDESAQPVFIHCHHGSDRTGVLCAAYRVVVQDWSKQDAIEEMTVGGFGYHPIWFNLVFTIENLDVERVRSAIGIENIDQPRLAQSDEVPDVSNPT